MNRFLFACPTNITTHYTNTHTETRLTRGQRSQSKNACLGSASSCSPENTSVVKDLLESLLADRAIARKAEAMTSGRTVQPSQQHVYWKSIRHQHAYMSDERNTSAAATPSSGEPSEASPSQQKLQPPRVQLRLRPIGWPDADAGGGAANSGATASVALDFCLIEGSDGRGYHGGNTGRRDRHPDDYWLLADFDSGAVRLWQVRCFGGHFSSANYGAGGRESKPRTSHA